MNAIAGLAAKREAAAVQKGATGGSQTPPPPSAESPPASPGQSNRFSVLQSLRQKQEPAKAPKTRPAPAPNRLAPGTPIHLATEAPKLTQYSSFRLSKGNSHLRRDGIVELRLKDGERFPVLGNYGIRVLTGEVTIAGATLRPSDTVHWVSAPSCYALPVLRTVNGTGLELHNDDNARQLVGLGRLSPLFRRIWNAPISKKGERPQTFQILETSEDAPKKCLTLSSLPEWNRKLAKLVDRSRSQSTDSISILVCGPKSAGKSTFARIMSNRLLHKTSAKQKTKVQGVVVMDLDPGQPEYTPAGCVSLVHVTKPNLGPTFSHTGSCVGGFDVLRSHALAAVSPASDPDLFIECVADLFAVYHATMADHPLVVNTPGWIQSTGLDLLVQIISHVRPDEVLYMSQDGPAESVTSLREATKGLFTELPSQQSGLGSSDASSLRAMQAMSYFHTSQNNANNTPLRTSWDDKPMAEVAPWQVRYGGPATTNGILGVICYGYQPPSTLLAEAINGMVLAAVVIEDPRAFRGLELPSDSAPGKLPRINNPRDLTLDPRYSRVLGLVLIHDVMPQCLEVSTPIPQHQIEAAGGRIVLVSGKFDTPTWAYTEQLYGQSSREDTNVTEEDEEEGEQEDAYIGNDLPLSRPMPVEEEDDKQPSHPWIEIRTGAYIRPVGSQPLRVRRDLGRGGN